MRTLLGLPILPSRLFTAAGIAAAALLIIALLLAATAAAAQQCRAATGGSPCEDATGVASLGDPDGTDVTVGNPIHPITGNKYQEETDSPALPGLLGLEIRRHFNSSYVSADGPWGKGWSMSYDTRVHRVGATLQIIQADGRRLMFGLPGSAAGDDAAAGACSSAGPGQGQLFVEGYGYRWLWPQQRELVFDQQGSLVQIGPRGAGAAESITIERGAGGRISRVTDPAGRTMRFDYDAQGYLSRIDHPLGQWLYRIDAGGRVQSVSSPDGVRRGYRYDDPGHPSRFTAITVSAAGVDEKVIGQWSYDAQGRADRYRRADGTELRLAFEQAPLDGGMAPAEGSAVSRRQGQAATQRPAASAVQTRSVLVNALGSRTDYTAIEIAGRWRITEIRGRGCEECGQTDIRMGYDAQGQLAARATIAGAGVAYQRDRFGRVTRIIPLEPREEGRGGVGVPGVQARPSPARPLPPSPVRADSQAPYLQRFEYPDDETRLPKLIARPSVVPGKEYRVVVERDDRGNVTRLMQSGYAPALSGSAATEPLPIVRTWELRYRQIGARRVLVELDGPLPNGPAGNPADSDITLFRYDEEGRHATEVQLPGGTTRRFDSRDPGGRPIVIATTDGHREFVERLLYDLGGRVLQSDTSARFTAGGGTAVLHEPQQTSFRYDLQGRLIRSTDNAGRSTRNQHDAVGRFIGVGDGRGYRSEVSRDAEGRVVRAALYRPGLEEPLRAAYHGRDDDGRLQSLLLADGSRYRFHHDAPGQAVGFTDGTGSLQSLPAATLPRGTGSEMVDDFGQVLKQFLPDHGPRTLRYDEAGRVVKVTDAAGVSTAYRYDNADRLLARSTDAGTGDVAFSYEGHLLAGVDDPAQTVRYRRDSRGRVIESSTTLHGLPGPALKLSTSYDPATGLVAAHGLAGGQSLQVRRSAALEGAVPRELHLRSAFWTLVAETLQHWLPGNLARSIADRLPKAAVARQIEVDPFDGLTGFVHHNGIALKRQFDPVGRTTRLVSGSVEQPLVQWRYTYGNGSRIKAIEAARSPEQPGTAGGSRQAFGYDAGGALRSVTQGADALARTSMAYPGHGSQVVDPALQMDPTGRVVLDQRFRYTYTGRGQVETVHDLKDNRLVASYAYNHRGQRVRKIVYGERGEPTTRYFLWSDRRLVAEIDSDGTVLQQFLSLDDGRRDLLIGTLRGTGKGGGSGGELMAVHADHRGAPVAMTDAQRQVVWSADLSVSGIADVRQRSGGQDSEGQDSDGQEFNLRLPGQYRDAETGLHDNWHRTYDPRRGRYLQPDPLGYPDGPDAYAYAGGDPINRTDPFGLYEIDVHYYMTFFLGVTAGLDPQEARLVALAAQYVDDNPLTRPVDPTHVGTTFASMFHNHRQLLGYHFALSGANGSTLPDYRSSQLSNADSPQLSNLLGAARSSGIGRNASLQFLGEYLHALADTYSHRDAANHPYDALTAYCGLGHGHALHAPDMTYDDVDASSGAGDEGRPPGRQAWRREARTLVMEGNLHAVLLAFGQPDKAKRFQEIESVLRDFNAIRESEATGSLRDFSQKIELLQARLVTLGFARLDLRNEDRFGYSARDARNYRETLLRDNHGSSLREEDFPGVCLEGGKRCTAP